MGITGLIPFLEKASTPFNIKQLEGSSVAVDSYCWLHRGVFACAERLIRGETTDIHIQYCLKYVDMLLRHKIKVIMVFDGRHLPAKAETERRRRQARIESKQLAKEYLRRNEIEKAKSHMRRAVDVTHEMALDLIKACRNRGVDCIVAPYEADAQMAWLNKQGLAKFVVTEDSDLTLFGAQKILFKLDLSGNALLVESAKLYLAMGCKPEKYTFDKFRRMCILSGCDYLDSLHGIGLKKACKFFLTTEEDDMKKALKKIPIYLKMKHLNVSDEYIESFLKAEATFKHMFVYNPMERRMERLHELDEFRTEESHCCNAGSVMENSEQAFQLALGNLNPFTLKQLDYWHPNQKLAHNKSKHKSIWEIAKDIQVDKKHTENQNSNETIGSMLYFKKIEYKNMAEKEIEEKLCEEKSKLEESEIFSMYKHASPKIERKRKRRQSSTSSCEDIEGKEKSLESVIISRKCSNNPFAKVNSELQKTREGPVCTNNSLLKYLSPKKANGESGKKDIMESRNTSVKSRFFAENLKQSVKKPFAARDLTSEMFEIEKKTKSYIKQQQDLYYCSLLSPEKETEENKQNRTDELLSDNCSYSSEVEIVKCIEGVSTLDSESINRCPDIEEEYSQKSSVVSSFNANSSSPQKTKSVIKKPQNITQSTHSKSVKTLGTLDAKQCKLSMFGFKKRSSLKKL